MPPELVTALGDGDRPGLHPVVVVSTFLVYAMVMALQPQPLMIGAALSVLGVGGWYRHGKDWRPVIDPLRRLRWFFLSLVVLYGWGTPGTPLWGTSIEGMASSWWMPTWEGAAAAFERIGALLAIMLAAVWLIERLARDELLLAIQGLVKPLATLGFPVRRFSLRLLLVIESIAEVQTIVVRCLSARDRDMTPLAQFGQLSARVFAAVAAGAETAPLAPIRLPAYRPPPPWQWSCPLGLVILGGLLN